MLPLLADGMSSGDWLAVGSAVGGGFITAAGIVAAAIKFAVGKLVEIRREERKHEAAMTEKFTTTTQKIQDQAAEDNRESTKALIELSKETIKAVAEVTGTVRELAGAVNELRAELTGQREKKKRPRVPNQEKGADGQD
jgi:malonyl CoA-acyl carrier protein transacylase